MGIPLMMTIGKEVMVYNDQDQKAEEDGDEGGCERMPHEVGFI
jgi:hypothetical protein